MGGSYNYNRTPNFTLYPGVTYRFYQEDDKHWTSNKVLNNTAWNTQQWYRVDINSDSTNDITYRNPWKFRCLHTNRIPTTGTNAATIVLLL